MSKTISYKDHFLVAMPKLDDPTFYQTVVLVQEHTEEDGALGTIINKPLQVKLKNVLEHLKIKITDKSVDNQPVFMGGPVDQEQGFVIHEPTTPQESNKKGYILSASRDNLIQIATGVGPKNYLVTLGYAGWKPGQLEQEVAKNDWLLVPVNSGIMFHTPIEMRWQQAIKLLGFDLHHLSEQVGHA